MSEPLQILLADDHPGIRRSLRTMLEARPGWRICGEAVNGREAIEEARRLAPDVAVIDVSMPVLDGLHATREIVRQHPGARVLILTMHESPQMTAAAVRAGAKGVVGKSDPPEALMAMIEMLAGAAEVHVCGTRVGAERHIAAFFSSHEERDRLLGPFVAEGLRQGEKVVHVVDPPRREAHIAALREQGVDLARAEAEGDARVLGWTDAYLRDDRFDPDMALAYMARLMAEEGAGGTRRTRLVAHMEWALSERPGVGEIAAYESRLELVLPRFAGTVICTYDLSQFGAATIVDVMRVHPALVVGGRLETNPFYAPPDEILPSLRARRTS